MGHLDTFTTGVMKSYELWMEGFEVTGSSSKAEFLGCYTAPSFRDAVLKWNEEQSDYDHYFVDPDSLSYWGCRIFDSEQEARKSFG